MAVWDLDTGERLRELTGHRDIVTSVAVSPRRPARRLRLRDRTVAVWDLATGERLRELAGHRRGVYCVAVSPDGRRAVSGSERPDRGGLR